MREYYFSNIHKSDLLNYSKHTQVKHLKGRCSNKLKPIKNKILSQIGLSVEEYWVSRETFGAILCDFRPEKTGPSIIGPHKAFFNIIKDEFNYVVFSDQIERNLETHDIEEYKILVVNVDRYKRFISAFSDKDRRIRLFLFTELSVDDEDIINNWIDSNPKKERTVVVDSSDVLKYIQSQDQNSIGTNIDRILSISDQKIINKFDEYKGKLNHFEQLINNKKTKESELRDFLFDNMWIIDFSFRKGQFELKKEVKVDSGKIDLWVSKFNFSYPKNIVIELKLANKSITVQYRNKEAVRSDIGKGLSQIIHYIESNKSKYKIQKGILIIGREPEEKFIDLFNQYLHGIEIKTYGQLLNSCRDLINGFNETL